VTKVLVCGDRNWTNADLIRTELQKIDDIELVIHGACKGADRIAGIVAKGLGIPVQEFPAQWKVYGKGAGPVRNHEMLDEGHPDRVLAFHNDISKSKGTAHMVSISTKAEVPTKVISENVCQ
jgi:hypothetical protein